MCLVAEPRALCVLFALSPAGEQREGSRSGSSCKRDSVRDWTQPGPHENIGVAPQPRFWGTVLARPLHAQTHVVSSLCADLCLVLLGVSAPGGLALSGDNVLLLSLSQKEQVGMRFR